MLEGGASVAGGTTTDTLTCGTTSTFLGLLSASAGVAAGGASTMGSLTCAGPLAAPSLGVTNDASVGGDLLVSGTTGLKSLSVTTGTTAVQALEATTGTFSGLLRADAGLTVSTGATALGDTLNVARDAIFQEDVAVLQVLRVTGELRVQDTAELGAGLEVIGSVAAGGTLNLDGAAVLQSTLDVTGQLTVSGPLEVAQGTVLNGPVLISGGIATGSFLTAAGKVSADSLQTSSRLTGASGTTVTLSPFGTGPVSGATVSLLPGSTDIGGVARIILPVGAALTAPTFLSIILATPVPALGQPGAMVVTPGSTNWGTARLRAGRNVTQPSIQIYGGTTDASTTGLNSYDLHYVIVGGT